VRTQSVGCLSDCFQAIAHRMKQQSAGIIEKDSALATFKKGQAQMYLHLTHCPADGSVSEVQLIGGPAEILEACGCLETAQGTQRRQTVSRIL